MNIKLEKFEGPLSLLLKLIEKEELNITEINLATIADQYIEYIKTTKLSPENVADFLVVASRLLLIKSKALLPYLTPEEEEDIEDFTAQLKMYKEFLEATKVIEDMVGKKKFMAIREFNRKAVLNIDKFCPPKKLKINDLEIVFNEILNSLKKEEKLEEATIEEEINIEEKIFSLKEAIEKKIKLSFNKIISQAKSKTEMIVHFLAMLELIKQREVVVEQTDMFGDIEINKFE